MAAEIPEKMLAARVIEFKRPYEIGEIPTPGKDLHDYGLLVKVEVGSLCHTDGMVTDGIMGTLLPCIASHEGAGTVVRIGSAIKDFKIGDRVLCSLIYHRCGAKYLGVTKDGSFAEYETVDGREFCRLPDNVSFQSAAPLACAGITVLGGLAMAALKAGECVAIVGGGGGLGHLGDIPSGPGTSLLVQFTKTLGLKVIAIDARDEGPALATDCGADTVVDARKGKTEFVKVVHSVTSGQGADATLNVSDHDSAAATGAAVTKMHGVLVQIAQPTNVSVPFAEPVFRDVKIQGSLVGSRGECKKMLETVSKYNIKLKSNTFNGIREIHKAVELAHSGKMQGKPVIIINPEAIEKGKKSGLQMV